MSQAKHAADMINNVYGPARTINWDPTNLHANCSGLQSSSWEGTTEILNFNDGSQATATYGPDGVKLTTTKNAKPIVLPKHIHIEGRRWFNKRTGNTYHSATITVDGNQVPGVNYAYGYDQQYVDSALTALVVQGILPTPEKNRSVHTQTVEKGVNITYHATDVNRKKDL